MDYGWAMMGRETHGWATTRVAPTGVNTCWDWDLVLRIRAGAASRFLGCARNDMGGLRRGMGWGGEVLLY